MNDNLLYENALYFKTNILPYFFAFTGKRGTLLVETMEYNFAHLVGKQYTTNINISHMNTNEFYKKCLKKELNIYDLIDIHDFINLNQNQKKIFYKNIYFINLFDSLINKINVRMYSLDEENTLKPLDIDYHHNEELKEYVNVLGIKGHDLDDMFSFASIIHASSKKEISRFTYKKVINFHLSQIKRRDIGKYINDIDYIIESPRNATNNHLKKSIKLNSVKKIDYKKLKTNINNILNEGLSIKVGMYGKNTIQVFVNGKLVENKLKLDSTYDNPQKIAEYINNHFSDVVNNIK